MLAMTLRDYRTDLIATDLALPIPSANEVLVEIASCGVCRTDLHILDGDLRQAKLPLVLGHEIVGRVKQIGENVADIKIGDLVGIPWLAETCGHCDFCLTQRENLCDDAKFTGYSKNGGYAQYTVANSRFCFVLPERFDAISAAPLMCAGLIGWRCLKMAGSGQNLGIYGFGAAGHIVAQIAVQQKRKVYAFTRPGDEETQDFARAVGAIWAGGSNQPPPEPLDAAIIFASVGSLIPTALKSLNKGGVLVCGGIHMSDIPSFPYSILWEERSIKSVANLTRQDGLEFMDALNQYDVRTKVTSYKLTEANRALSDLRTGAFDGAAVLITNE